MTFLTVTGQAHNFNKYSHGKLDYLGAMYDFQSLMHYGSHAFSKNGKRTIKAIKQTSQQFGQRKGFSQTDIQQLNALYDCKSEYMTWKNGPKNLLKSWPSRLNVGLVRAHREAKILGALTIPHLSWFFAKVTTTNLSDFCCASRSNRSLVRGFKMLAV